MTRNELIEALLYLWTRDAGVDPLEVERYIVARVPSPSLRPVYTDEDRLEAIRIALSTSCNWMMKE